MTRLNRLLTPTRTKLLLAVLFLGLIALGLGQGWVFADQETPPPPWALPGPLAMAAWTVAVYLMVPVMALNLPLVLVFHLDLFQLPVLPFVLAVGVAYLWAVFFVSVGHILRTKGEGG